MDVALVARVRIGGVCICVCVQAAPEQKKGDAASSPAAAAPAAASAAPASTAVVTDDTLETPWTFYFDKKLSRESQAVATQAQGGYTNYAQNLQKIGSFNSLKTFWQHYSYMQTPDAIPKDHNL